MARVPRFALTLTLTLLVACVVVAAPAVAKPKHRPTYTSSHFKGPKTLPKNFVAAKPPPPVTLATDGQLPHVFVDAAGTAHVAWAQNDNGVPGVMHYCRLPRGAKACTAAQAITIQQPQTGGNGPATDIDFQGPIPLAIGNELIAIDARCCNNQPIPGGDSTGNPTYLFTSEDGGPTFTGPSDPNSSAGLIGTLAPSGGAAVFGGANPSIGIVSDTQTGGTFFQGIAPGAFLKDLTNLSVEPSPHNDAYDGRIGVDGTLPIVAFDDLSGNTYVREWTGAGSVDDASQWSTTQLSNNYIPRIAGGPKGVVLLTQPTLIGGSLSARRVTNAGTTIGPPTLLTPHNARLTAISADPVSGEIAATWMQDDDVNGQGGGIHVRTSADGGLTWGLDQIVVPVTQSGEPNDVQVAATGDGGGFVTYHLPAADNDGTVQVAQFGSIGATRKPGLGLAPGGSGPTGGDTTAYATCTDVHMGDIDALATAGCWLRDPKNQGSGAAMAQGPIRLNGLDIVPDAGVHIYIDPRQHTIETDGSVSVELTGLADGPITLWHGALKVTLPAVGDSATLFDFDMSQFAGQLKGFPLDGQVEVKLTHDGVSIPVHVQLPAYMGGVHGDATLTADNATGLHLDSMDIGIDDVNVGALEFKNIAIDYTSANDEWRGQGEVLFPGPLSPDFTLRDIDFQHGQFHDASVELGLYPGIPVFTDVYIHSIGVAIGLHPTTIEGDVTAGAIPIAPPDTYTVTVTGTIKLQIGDSGHPTVFFVGGSGAILGFDLVQASFTYNSDGYALFHVGLDYGGDSKWASFSASGDVFILHGDFGAVLDAHGCLVYLCGGLKAGASSKGVAVCDEGEDAGADLTFSPFSVDIHPTSCHISDFVTQPPPPGARAAVAADVGSVSRTFVVPAGQTGVDLQVTGVGAAPDVVLVDPAGQIVTPQPLTVKGAAVVGGPDPTPGATDTVIGLRKPAAGTWTIKTDAGSPGIASVATAHDVALPVVKASVTGSSGAARTLRYSVSGVTAGTTVQFAEKTSEGLHRIGATSGARGTLSFVPAPGKGGRRSVIAVIMQSGFDRGEPVIAQFVAQGIRTPGHVARVSVTHRGTTATVHFGSAVGATSYAVLLKASDGTAVQQTVRHGHSTRFRGLRAGAKVQAFVRGVNVRGTRGPATASKKR
jgi:hypothetical protein